MLRNAFEGWHIVILALVIVVVFGWKRLPDAARSLGRSMRIFKAEVTEMKTDGKPTSAASAETVRGDVVPPPPPVPPVHETRQTPYDPTVTGSAAPSPFADSPTSEQAQAPAPQNHQHSV